jgi:hypothetical protein
MHSCVCPPRIDCNAVGALYASKLRPRVTPHSKDGALKVAVSLLCALYNIPVKVHVLQEWRFIHACAIRRMRAHNQLIETGYVVRLDKQYLLEQKIASIETCSVEHRRLQATLLENGTASPRHMLRPPLE